MRIAMIHTPLKHPGGGEKQVLKLALELSKRGHTVEIFTNALDRERCYPELQRQVSITVVPPKMNLAGRLLGSIGHRFGMGDTIGRLEMLSIAGGLPREKFDIINCHNFSSNWAAWLAKRRLDIPVVWMCNEPPYWYYQPGARKISTCLFESLFLHVFDKYTVKAVDEIVVLSRSFAALVKSIYGRSAVLVRSGVDPVAGPGRGTGDAVRKEFGLEGKFILLHVGSASAYKNDMCPLMALHSLASRFPDLRMIFVGNNTREFFGPEAARLGLGEKVLFFGALREEALAGFYSACDVFLFPVAQSWGLAAVEAMAAGKPVIVSGRTGVSEVIEDGVNGMVVEHGQPGQAADCIERLLKDPALKEKIGANASDFVKTNLSWEKYTLAMSDIFDRVLREYRKK